MQGSKVLWLTAVLVAGVALGAVWCATQWTASALGYQPGLGPPWFVLSDHPIYPPPAFFWWWFVYDAYAPNVFLRGAAIAASGGILCAALAMALSVWRGREHHGASTFGTARWATDKEVRAAGLLGDEGVFLGRYGEQYLRHDGPEHILGFAPTRMGKGVGWVVPSLQTWAASTIVHDIKGENWTLTAGFRATLGPVLLFDPTNPASSAYNPLLEVRPGETEVRDVQNIADILVDPEGSLDKRSHWEKTSHSLLVGAILHVLYAEPDKTLAGVATFLSDPLRSIEQTLAVMMRTQHLGEAGTHPVVASAARELLNKSDNERSGVLSTAMTFLGLYRDPVVAAVTSRCDWRIADLVASPCSLYLVVPPSDVSRTRPLIRLILNQIVRRLTESLEGVAARQKLLLMLDELPVLGRLDFLESTLAFMAGYGIRAFLITQSLEGADRSHWSLPFRVCGRVHRDLDGDRWTGGERRTCSAPRAPAGSPKDRRRRVSCLARNGGAPPGEESRQTRLPGFRPSVRSGHESSRVDAPADTAGRLRRRDPSPPTPTVRSRASPAPLP